MPVDSGVAAVIASAERIRTTAGWLLASLGAAAGVLLVGTDLSALEDVTKASNVRWALVGVALATLATARAIFMVARVLAPAQHLHSDRQPSSAVDDPHLKRIVDAEPQLLQELANDVGALWALHKQRVIELNEAQDAYVAAPDPTTEKSVRVAQAHLASTSPVVEHLRALALYELLRDRYAEAVRSVALCSLGVTLGVLLFNLAVRDLLDLVF